MNIKKHFRISKSTVDYIISDFNSNKIVNKEIYFKHCIVDRMTLINNKYNEKIDKILNCIIRNCNYDNIPINLLSRIILSLSKVTNALSKGFLSIIN